MTVQEFLDRATSALRQAGIESARLDVLILLEDALGQDRTSILAHPNSEIPTTTEVTLNTKIVQRVRHTPLAYIRGKVEFYGREFTVNEHVLVPRPETETMIGLLKQLNLGAQGDNLTIIDIGTGSGAIAITAKLEFPKFDVIATDIDPETLKIARQNATKLSASIILLQSDLLESTINGKLSGTPTILLTNLPYVPERYTINRAAEHEPKHAIFGGKDGLNLYRQLWEQIAEMPNSPLFVLTEALPPQHADMLILAQNAGFELHNSEDFIQVFKKSN